MICDAVLHLNNDQPMRADLYELPLATDQGLRCTNLRTMNNKRPVSVDDSSSVFYFPYLHIRFVEIPTASMAGSRLAAGDGDADRERAEPAEAPEAEADIEIDEDFLRRIREV